MITVNQTVMGAFLHTEYGLGQGIVSYLVDGVEKGRMWLSQARLYARIPSTGINPLNKLSRDPIIVDGSTHRIKLESLAEMYDRLCKDEFVPRGLLVEYPADSGTYVPAYTEKDLTWKVIAVEDEWDGPEVIIEEMRLLRGGTPRN